MIPPFEEYLMPFLKYMGDGNVRRLSDVMEALKASMQLTASDLEETVKKTGRSRHIDRCSWAKTYLFKAGLIEFPERANFRITPAGSKIIESGVEVLTRKYLAENYPSFAEFIKKKNKTMGGHSQQLGQPADEDRTPLERLVDAHNELKSTLIEDLLGYIREQSPSFFEQLVVQLLVKMGYGGDIEDAAMVTQLSHDGGIDGIIKQDALGIDRIYIQAKRWSDKTVGSADIQQFKGALLSAGASKGVYITTAKFSDGARQDANKGSIRIILIDGDQLARYMIQYNVGVITQETFEVKRVDVGFFKPEE